MAYTGDVPANKSVGAGQSLIRNSGDTDFEYQRLDLRTFTLGISSPTVRAYPMVYVYEGVTVTSIYGVTAGGTSITFNVEYRSDPSSAGTNIMNTDLTVDLSSSSTTGLSTAVSAGNWLAVDVSNVNGTVTTALIIINAYVT